MVITTDTQTRITWRTTRPINRDAVCLQIVKYEWDATSHRSWLLLLTPEPHWHEFRENEMIPESTVELSGLDMILMIGNRKEDWPNDFDPRKTLADRMDAKIANAIRGIMDLEPPVTLNEE
jgi:hypothetical protein